jgi:prepilin-type N-terminal cleavage/methylation domain-containing protein/prepilin-type processing-associated H-X9-DG protein
MEPNTSPTNTASGNGASVGSLAGRRLQAFTLIELLVVIAIISILMAVLLGVLGTIRNMVKQKVCQSHLRSMGVTADLYANDHGGLFPNPKVTFNPKVVDDSQIALKVRHAFQPYVNSDEIFCCPSDPLKPTPPGGSYAPRLTLDPKTSLGGVRLDLIRHPDRVVIAGERSAGWHKSCTINVLYLDGHVEQVTEEEWWENITTPLDSL